MVDAPPRLLIVGWDAADWKVIDPMLQRGELPNLARLVSGGVRGNLASMDPKLSPILWTTIATGKTADKHGILNFLEPDAEGRDVRVSSSTSRRVKALWNILSQSGKRTLLVNWYASHPAEAIRGAVVSNLFQEGCPGAPADAWPEMPGAVHPSALAADVAASRMHPGELLLEELASLLPHLAEMSPDDRPVALVAKAVAQCASVHNVATGLMAKEEWDCAMVFYDTIDVLGHHFMQYHPPRMEHVSERDFRLFRGVMEGAYRLQDMMLGTLLDLAGARTRVILLSDHGFYSDELRPRVPVNVDDPHVVLDATWHRHHGVLVMHGPGIKVGERVFGTTLLDVAPTALALLGLAVGADMDGRVLAEVLEPPPVIDRVFSWEDIAGESGMHPPEMRQNTFESHEAVRQLIDLGYVAELPSDRGAALELVRRETIFNLALVYLTTRRPGQALALLEEAHRLKPDEGRYAVNLARCHAAMGKAGEARSLLEGLLARHPDSADLKLMLGEVLTIAGERGTALAILHEVRAGHPDRVDLLVALGEALVFAGRPDEAEPLLLRAIGLDLQSARAHHGLGLIALERREWEEAVSRCLSAVELMHFYPDAHYTMGVALTWMKDFEHAIKAFEVALSMQPGLIDAHRYLASIFRHLGRPADAGKHRQASERLTRERAAGTQSPEHGIREAPMGPQEWVRSLGVPGD
jgi:predicted AlkP superfamily phosphohydrolase/phosphomutase/tetratricopeptide (TPR) repeat protein